MIILKLLNKKNLSILFSILFFQNIYAVEAVDIWNIEKKSSDINVNKNQAVENEDKNDETVFGIQSDNKKISIAEDNNLLSSDISIAGIYDPSDNDLTIDMWENSNGLKILETINKIKKINLSEDSAHFLNIALLTNSYFPKKNITKEEFFKIKSDWLIKQQNLKLIETYIEKNQNLENEIDLIKYYLDYYLSRSDLSNACKIFDKINFSIDDNYLSKFNIYCLINENKIEEASLRYDLIKEIGFEDLFFEKVFFHLIGYEENTVNEISENSLLDFHLSHRTHSDFDFEPEITTSKLIWKYLSSANLLQSVDYIDLEDKEKIFTIEKATHDKNYDEEELFSLYRRFIFNINQLLTVNETHKLLQNSEARALIYQCILLNNNDAEKIALIKILKDLFEKDNISNAFDNNLIKFLKKIPKDQVPSNYSSFYEFYLKDSNKKNKKTKFNNKVIHQSKILEYFNDKLNKKNTEKELNSLLQKIKKDKKYFVSTKDTILLQSLKSDGVKILKKYENFYNKTEANIPYDIQILINKNEIGLVLLRLVEIIGEDKVEDIDSENLYFIISILNQINADKLRNRILLKVLPLKV